MAGLATWDAPQIQHGQSTKRTRPFFVPCISSPPLAFGGRRNKSPRKMRVTDAQRISGTIDQDLKKDRLALKKEQNVVRVLLLGQSESGKSTTLKNFRMRYAYAAWKEERLSWRAVIQLNIIRSIVTIVEAVQLEMLGNRSDLLFSEVEDGIDSEEPEDDAPIVFSDKHHQLKLRLRPLREVEEDLKRRLGARSEEQQNTSPPSRLTPFDSGFVPGDVGTTPRKRKAEEFVLRRWPDPFKARNSLTLSNRASGRKHAEVDSATKVIASCKDDMKALWHDETVRALLLKRNIRLQDSAGFFLDDLDRIAALSYEPSDDDILRARLRTIGVQEYRLYLDDLNSEPTTRGHIQSECDWIMYDVGDTRSSRAAWIPYFENVNAIIFLAPVSCFDERLPEDPKLNRIEDSFMLWRIISSSKLLAQTTMIVLLNKCDLLKRKLESGVMVNRYIPSYGNRPNDLQHAVKYFRDKFKDASRQYSPEPRTCQLFATSLINTKSTGAIINSVRMGILQEHLKYAGLM